MKNFRNLRKEAAGEDVSSYSSRRLATILKDPKHPMHAVAKGEMDRRKMQSEGKEIDEISLAHLTKKIANSGGMKQVSKANKADKLKKDLEAMKKRMATEEQECPHCDMEDGEHEKDCPMMQEKTLTPAEKKKREEIAKAMERDNPGMPMAKKMAIATATAKKVAEEVQLDEIKKGDFVKDNRGEVHRVLDVKGTTVTAAPHRGGDNYGGARTMHKTKVTKIVKEEVELDEGIEKMSHSRLKWHMNTGVPHGSYSKDEMKAERDRRMQHRDSADAYKKAKPSMSEEAKPDAVEVMRKKQQMANISTSDKDKLAKIRAMLDKERKGK